MKKYRSIIRKACLSLLLAVFTLLVWLWVSGLSIPLTGEVTLLKYIEILKNAMDINSHDDELLREATFINIAYDKELVPVVDEYGFPKGKMAITDREALYRLLQLANANGAYRQILLDVYLDPMLTTDVDSMLYNLIAQTPRLYIPKHSHMALPDEVLRAKAAYSDYFGINGQNDFMKYPLFIHGESTLALKMYAEATGSECHDGWITASMNGRMMMGSIIPSLRLAALPEYNGDGEKIIYNLTEDILSVGDSLLTNSLLGDKDIIIGDLSESDMHDTFRGMVPGALIHYDTYLDLLHGHHFIRWWYLLLSGLIFWLICHHILWGTNSLHFKNHVVQVIIGWFSYSVLLSMMSILAYLVFSSVFDLFITSIIFTLYRQIFNVIGKYENNIKSLLIHVVGLFKCVCRRLSHCAYKQRNG